MCVWGGDVGEGGMCVLRMGCIKLVLCEGGGGGGGLGKGVCVC